jgi:signal transduction histidine kinase/HAMP domain-containing protein
MSRFSIGMRWWLAVAFALVSGLTALAIALVSSERSEQAFRSRTDVLALGNTVAATLRLREALSVADQERAQALAPAQAEETGLATAFEEGQLTTLLRDIGENNELSVFVFGDDARLLSSDVSRGIDVSFVPDFPAAVEAGLEGRRSVRTLQDPAATVVALPLLVPLVGRGVVLTYVPQPEFASAVGIFRREVLFAALVAIPVGALAGMIIAVAIAGRLRRIADAAAKIEAGDFDTELHPRFRDELGSLELSIDRMREQLRESFALLASDRDRLGQLLERLRDGVVTVDRDLHVEFANGAARRALGISELDGPTVLPDPWEELDLQALASGLFRDHAQIAQARVTPTGEETYDVVGIPAGDVGESAVLVVRDVSEQERRERAEREFVTNAAHELRTPLAAISSAVEVLQSGAKEIPDDRDRFLDHIEREAHRLGRLARALLVLARAQTNQEQPRREPVPLKPILDDVSAGLQVGENVSVEVSCPPELAALSDPDLVEQTIVNLAANAAKHTEAGTISLAAREGHGSRVVIEIRDTGSGIPSREQERVFDRFFRGDDAGEGEGFGLGLAIVRQSVRALGGKVSIRSRAGVGTTVEVMLPSAEQPERSAREMARSSV